MELYHANIDARAGHINTKKNMCFGKNSCLENTVYISILKSNQYIFIRDYLHKSADSPLSLLMINKLYLRNFSRNFSRSTYIFTSHTHTFCTIFNNNLYSTTNSERIASRSCLWEASNAVFLFFFFIILAVFFVLNIVSLSNQIKVLKEWVSKLAWGCHTNDLHCLEWLLLNTQSILI